MKFRKLFKEKGKHTAVAQTAGQRTHPFSELDRYVPLACPERRLFASLREAIPVIDAAILKTVRLVGGFRVETKNSAAQHSLDKFLKSVRVGSFSVGIEAFISSYLDQLITYGTSVGEIVISPDMQNISALYNADLNDIEIKSGDNPLNPQIFVKGGTKLLPVKYPQLILVSALNPKPNMPYGVSVLSGLPFVSSILLKIYNTTGINFDRVGNMRFAVTYRPGGEVSNLRDKANAIASEWSKAMNSTDGVSDFISVGDIDIKVIGADNKIIDTEIPVRQMLEQIVAKMGIPPFLLGLSWSSTERMSAQQCDILTSELESYRRILEPVITKIASMYLRLCGYDDTVTVTWDNISLQDELDLAKARLYNAQAQKIEEELSDGKQ